MSVDVNTAVSAPVESDAVRSRWRSVLAATVAGVALAVLWSFSFVDSVIGDTIANGLLGHDAKESSISGVVPGLVFALVSGLAGTFTACNIAMASAFGPLSAAARSGSATAGESAGPGGRPRSLRVLIRPVGFLTLGMVAVSGTYGFIGVLLGDSLPQLSTATVGDMPVRLLQASIVFGIIALVLLWMGLASLGIFRDPFASRPVARVVTLGALVGGFLVGRPFPLFNKLFHWAVEQGNPLVGAAAFFLQSLGNIAFISVVYASAILLTRGRLLAWIAGTPRRQALVSGTLLVGLGVFTLVYWDVRVPAMFGVGWFPTMPYNR